jgi:hypothetical protein
LFSLGVISSCKSSKLNKYKYYKEQFKIINYVFPPEIDSVLCVFFDFQYNKTNKNNWCMALGIIKENTYILKVYYVVSGIDKKIEFKSLGEYASVDDMEKFLISRTNRYSVIGKGKYIIPLYFDYDQAFTGYGKVEYPLNSFVVSGGNLIIVFKDWKIEEIWEGHMRVK